MQKNSSKLGFCPLAVDVRKSTPAKNTKVFGVFGLVNNWISTFQPGTALVCVARCGVAPGMVKSPLLIGSDVRSIANDSLALLKNAELIAVNRATTNQKKNGPSGLQSQ